MLIAFAHIIVIDIQVCLLCDGHAGMAQNFAQSVNVHSVHQASFGEVVPQAVWGNGFLETGAKQIFFEIRFEV